MDQLESQETPNDTRFKPPIDNAEYISGSKKCPDVGSNCDYGNDKLSEVFVETFLVLGIRQKRTCFNHIYLENVSDEKSIEIR